MNIYHYRFYKNQRLIDQHELSIKNIPGDSTQVQELVKNWIKDVSLSTSTFCPDVVTKIGNLVPSSYISVTTDGHREKVTKVTRTENKIVIQNYIRSFEIKSYGFTTSPTK